jgi:hypothetical protein
LASELGPGRCATKRTTWFFGERLPRSIKMRISEGAALDSGPMVLRLLFFRWLLRDTEDRRRAMVSKHKDFNDPVCYCFSFEVLCVRKTLQIWRPILGHRSVARPRAPRLAIMPKPNSPTYMQFFIFR